jgi:hypothetical protein
MVGIGICCNTRLQIGVQQRKLVSRPVETDLSEAATALSAGALAFGNSGVDGMQVHQH